MLGKRYENVVTLVHIMMELIYVVGKPLKKVYVSLFQRVISVIWDIKKMIGEAEKK